MLQLRQTHPETTEGAEKVITPKMKRRITREMCTEKPTIWVGKDGVTRRTIDEVARQLEKREMVKVKILKSALGDEQAKDLASTIAEQTESTLVEVRGHTPILYKPCEE
jgi:RNA-binding protein